MSVGPANRLANELLELAANRGASLAARLAEQATAFVQQLRSVELYKQAGISETLDWVAALVALDRTELEPAVVDQTLGILVKNQEDLQAVRGENGARLEELVGRTRERPLR